MGLKVNETINGEIYGSEQYVSSRKGSEEDPVGKAPEQADTYEHGEEQSAAYGVYTKAQIMGTAGSAENNQFQNNLKILGFYSASVATDGNLGSQESLRAIKNFQKVYGLPVNGGSNDETRRKLNEVVEFYNNTLNDPDLPAVAQRKAGYVDYNENIVKADIAKAWTFLRKGMNLTAKKAAGIMGNIIEESGASPINANDAAMGVNRLRDTTYTFSATDGIAYGIIQWRGSRKEGLLDMAVELKSSVSDYNVQFAFLKYELEEGDEKGNWNKIKDTDDYALMAEKFCNTIERTTWADIRRQHAEAIYNALT